MTPSSFPKKRVIFGFTILLLDVVAIYLMIEYGKSRRNPELEKLGYDTIRLSIQLFLIVVIGGIFIQEYNRARARKDVVNEFRRTTLKSLSRAYSDVKRVRRIVRAKCEAISSKDSKQSDEKIPLAIYDEQISTINSTQLELEILVRELKIIKGVFKETKKLIKNIRTMEKYLGEIIEEYEIKLKEHPGSISIPLSALPRFRGLIAKNKHSEFSKFFKSYRKALIFIEEQRIKIS